MAVIRQRQQAFQRRIGVVNLDTGASQVGETASRAAQSIASAAEPFARDEAIRRGTNFAKEIKRQNLITFDDNGTPIGLTAPREFGLVARQAYDQVAERRFNESMLEELESKSIEIAKKYPDPNTYDTMYSEYLKGMDKAAGGRFAEYIATEGGKIFTKTRTTLEIESEKQRLKNIKAAAKFNTYRKLRELERSTAMSVTPESIIELSVHAKDAQIAAQEEFAVTKDRVQYFKVLDEIGSHQAGATVNLLINSAKFVSDSQREAIEAAIRSPSFVSMVDDSTMRRQILAVHSLSNGLGLEKLASAFETGANAIEAIEADMESEWMLSQESTIETLGGTKFADPAEEITAWTKWADSAPETASKDARGIMITALSDSFINSLVASFTKEMTSDDYKLLGNSIESFLKSGSTEALNRIKSGNVRRILKSIDVLDSNAKDLIAKSIKGAIDPETGSIELMEAAAKKIADDEERNDKALASTKFNEAQAEIDHAINTKNYLDAISAFQTIDPKHLVGTQLAQWEKWSATLREELKLKGNEDARNEITKSEAKHLELKINEMTALESVSETGSAKIRLRKYVMDLVGEHSATQIGTWLDQIDAAHNKLVNQSITHKDIDFENQARSLVEGFEDLAGDGIVISLTDLNKAKKETRDLIQSKSGPFDEKQFNELVSKLEVQYAYSLANNVYRNLSTLTNGNGISPNRLEVVLGMKEDELNNLDKTTAEYKVGIALFEARTFFDAKSEVRTIINQISKQNKVLFENFTNELNINTNVSNVRVNTVNSTNEELQDYENEVYKKQLGLQPNQAINFDAPDLLMKDGVATDFGKQLQLDFSQGIITPQIKLALQKAAATGIASDNVFQLFNMGSGTSKNGDVLRIWHMDKRVDAKSIARLGAAMLASESGFAESPQAALSQIVSNANELGGDIRKSLEVTIDSKLDEWILKNYSDADAITRQRLLEASIALGSTATSRDDLKESLDRWIDVTFGEDEMVIGNRVSDNKVVGARTKYINSDEMKAMDEAATQLVYASVSEEDRARLFRSLDPSYEREALITNLTTQDSPKIQPLFELKYKESPARNGIYYVYLKTDFGLVQQNKLSGEPIALNTLDFKEKEEPHTFVSFYHTAYRSALQNDPNGGEYGFPSYTKMLGQVLGLVDKPNPPPKSQKTIDAMEALVFARFPKRINDPEMREVFDGLVARGVILPEHVDEFLAAAGISDE